MSRAGATGKSDALPPAVVFGLDSAGLEVCRALGRRGVPVIGLDTRTSIAAASRYCKARLCADPRRAPEQLLRELLTLAGELADRPVLMPLSDDWVVFMANHRGELAKHYRFVQPAPELLLQLVDKCEIHELARQHGLDIPRQLTVEQPADLARVEGEVGFPCLLKPARTQDWRQPEARAALNSEKVLFARDAAALQETYRRAAPFAVRHVAQEFLAGPDRDNYYVSAYIDQSGRLRAAFVHRKLIMRPPGRGIGVLIESIRRDELTAQTARLLLAIGHRGLAGLEFKLDQRDGRYKLLDFNPRWGQGDSLAANCGMDLAWLYYCDCLGREAQVPAEYPQGVKWLQLRPFLAAIRSARRERKESIWRNLWALRGPLHHSVFAWDDLGPARWMVWDMLTARFKGRRGRIACRATGPGRDEEA